MENKKRIKNYSTPLCLTQDENYLAVGCEGGILHEINLEHGVAGASQDHRQIVDFNINQYKIAYNSNDSPCVSGPGGCSIS
jgi:hypothetical protein